VSLRAECTWSTITVDIVDSSSDFDYSRALYYVCDSANISGSLVGPVPAEDYSTRVTEEIDLPPGTTCTVFGCYVEFDFGLYRLFINGSCTTGKGRAWMNDTRTECTQCSCSLPDIDECELEPCHEQATCTNTDGSYTCACNPGFSGDGTDCEGICTAGSPAFSS